MKKLLVATLIAIAISTSAHAEDCFATDSCVLFTKLEDLADAAKLYQQGGDIFQFAINELIASGRLIKLDRGLRVNVVAKSGMLYQVFYNGKIFYTINQAVNCR